MALPSIVERLKSGEKDALGELYQAFRSEFLSWASKTYRCPRAQALDAYQNAVLIFYENCVAGKLDLLNSSDKTYLFAIGKNKILETLRAEGRLKNIDEMDILDETEIKTDPSLIQRASQCLEQLGEPCKQLLQEFYYHGHTMSQITTMLGYKNEDTAKSQKYKCLARLRRLYLAEK